MAEGSKMGQWAFIIGILLAVLLGFVPENLLGMATLVLVVLGLIVGFLNVTEKETTPFLIAGIALLATGNASDSLRVIPPDVLGSFLVGAVNNIAAFVAPAAIVVALKAIQSLAKD
ncbi:hypothetical protein HYX02_00490 [Candidatus Woesearchaeota archaeon]|nr:hypothetical protein [Candidatus Woesearchaeota archaeon]